MFDNLALHHGNLGFKDRLRAIVDFKLSVGISKGSEQDRKANIHLVRIFT